MPVDGGQVINNLKHQCEILKEGEKKAVVIKKISEELYKHMKEVITTSNCKIEWDRKNNKIIIKKKVKNKNDDITNEENLGAIVDAAIARGDKQMDKKERDVMKKDEEITRLASMNPTREFGNFAKNFDKYFDEGDYDKLLEDAKRVKKAIAYPVDKNDYEIWIKAYKEKIIPEINKKLEDKSISEETRNTLKTLKKVIQYIIDNTKTKNIGLS